MGLTIFIDKEKLHVNVLRWFLNSKGTLECAHGPLVAFGAQEFRQNGLQFIREHFALYKEKRLSPGETALVLETAEDKKFLRKQSAIQISEYPTGVLILMPLEFKKFSLDGLKPLPKETETTFSLNEDQSEFWRAFDKAFAAIE